MKKIIFLAGILSALLSPAATFSQFYNKQKTLYVTTEGKVYGVLKGPYSDTVDGTHELEFPSSAVKRDTILQVILLALYDNWEKQIIDRFNDRVDVHMLWHQVDSLERRIAALESLSTLRPGLWDAWYQPTGSYNPVLPENWWRPGVPPWMDSVYHLQQGDTILGYMNGSGGPIRSKPRKVIKRAKAKPKPALRPIKDSKS